MSVDHSLDKLHMETRLTTWDAAGLLAKKTGISSDQVQKILQAQAELAYEHCNTGYPIAGVGILLKVEQPAREARMPFGPDAGKVITIPAKAVLKFRVAKAAKDIVVGPRTVSVVDVMNLDLGADEQSGEATE